MPGDLLVGGGACDLEVDVAVEQVEALLAGQLRAVGPEQAGGDLAIRCGHDISRAASAARSLRRASWMVL